MSNSKLYKNTAMLFAAMTITKIVGAIFKIPLANILGGTGMGYFSTAYGLYSPIFALTAAGIPTVLMRLTAQNLAVGRYQNALKTKRTAMIVFGMIGLLGTLLIWVFSGYFAENIAYSPESKWAVFMIAPAVFLCCIASVIRGYYEGQSNVLPTAAANVTEAISRAVIGLALSYGVIFYAKYTYENGIAFLGKFYTTHEETYSAALPIAAAAAIFAVSLSELCGLVALIVQDKRYRKTGFIDTIPLDRKRMIAVQLIKELLPIAASALVMNCFSFADLITVTRTINASIFNEHHYFTRVFADVIRTDVPLYGLANFMYGSYTGIAMSLFMLIPSFAGMSEKTVTPEIASAWEKKDNKDIISKITILLRTTALIGFPACLGAAALAEPILTMLYKNRLSEISVCINSFTILCLGGFFIILSSIISGIFQAIGKSHISLFLMCGGVVVKFTLNPILLGIKELNISGAALSTVISYMLIALTSVIILKKYITKLRIFPIIVCPFISGLLCAVSSKMVYKLLESNFPQPISVVLSIAIGGFVYVILLILTGFFRTSHIINNQKRKKITKGVEKKIKIG